MLMNLIKRIIEQRRVRLIEAQSSVSINEVRRRAESMERGADFQSAITRTSLDQPLRLIAELKKASPSKGLIREDFDPEAIASIYDRKADAISVLTEEDFFQGSLENIWRVKSVSSRPILRKDFIIDEYQIYEARAAGASALLLIGMALERHQLEEYLALSEELGMDVLYEVHEFDELETALELKADIIGINNRDLRTLQTDLAITFEMMREIPRGVTVVSESGISSYDDVQRLQDAEVDAMLVGTSLMKEQDIAAAIDRLRNNPQ